MGKDGVRIVHWFYVTGQASVWFCLPCWIYGVWQVWTGLVEGCLIGDPQLALGPVLG